MDRRQRKTRQAIFTALTELLEKKDFYHITVGEIIEKADVGRATFYAHFETKDFLLKALCEDLFCHIFDAPNSDHRHMFQCDAPDCVFLHLFRHLSQNDNKILNLLSCDLFLTEFKSHLQKIAADQLPKLGDRKHETLPEHFWIDHICETFLATLRWWMANGRKESTETITEYFYLAV